MNYSRQKSSILDNLAGRYDHPTADMVYESVIKTQPHISLGTVYRNLSRLCESGEIIKISVLNGPDRFDYNTDPHVHFMCKACGKMSDINTDISKLVNMHEVKALQNQTDTVSLVLYGTCQDCI